MYVIKFIKNPPTVENLKSLYDSEMYQNMLDEFAKRTKHELDNRAQNLTALFNKNNTFPKALFDFKYSV